MCWPPRGSSWGRRSLPGESLCVFPDPGGPKWRHPRPESRCDTKINLCHILMFINKNKLGDSLLWKRTEYFLPPPSVQSPPEAWQEEKWEWELCMSYLLQPASFLSFYRPKVHNNFTHMLFALEGGVGPTLLGWLTPE